jgi:hypothetical protein
MTSDNVEIRGQYKFKNGIEEVVGSIPSGSTKNPLSPWET